MTNIKATTLNGGINELDSDAIQILETGIGGNVFVFGDREYDTIRKEWNGTTNHYPALIIQCANASDVSRCVNFPGDNSQLISVRCGVHNFAGLSVADGGLMNDVSLLRSIEVKTL